MFGGMPIVGDVKLVFTTAAAAAAAAALLAYCHSAITTVVQ